MSLNIDQFTFLNAISNVNKDSSQDFTSKYKQLKKTNSTRLKSFNDIFNTANQLLKQCKRPEEMNNIKNAFKIIKGKSEEIALADSNPVVRFFMRFFPSIKEKKMKLIEKYCNNLEKFDTTRSEREYRSQDGKLATVIKTFPEDLPAKIQKNAHNFLLSKKPKDIENTLLTLQYDDTLAFESKFLFRNLTQELRNIKDPDKKLTHLQKMLNPFLDTYIKKHSSLGVTKELILRFAIASAKDLMPEFYVQLHGLYGKDLWNTKEINEFASGKQILPLLDAQGPPISYRKKIKKNLDRMEKECEVTGDKEVPEAKFVRNKAFKKVAKQAFREISREMSRNTSTKEQMKTIHEKINSLAQKSSQALGVKKLDPEEIFPILFGMLIVNKHEAGSLIWQFSESFYYSLDSNSNLESESESDLVDRLKVLAFRLNQLKNIIENQRKRV